MINADRVFSQPRFVAAVPPCCTAIGDDDDPARVTKHRQGVFDGLVSPPIDGDSLLLNAVAVAIFAKKHTVPETWSYSGDVRRDMENACCQQETSAVVGDRKSV